MGCVDLATTVHDWTAAEAAVDPGDRPVGVLLPTIVLNEVAATTLTKGAFWPMPPPRIELGHAV